MNNAHRAVLEVLAGFAVARGGSSNVVRPADR